MSLLNDRKKPKPEQPAAGESQSPDSATRDDLQGAPTLGFEGLGASRDLTGITIGDYEVLGLIGSGGSGQVYKAQHRHMGRLVALKVMATKELGSSAVAQRFRREVKAAARLMHPNIVTAFDAGEYENELYLVMEFVDGKSLDILIRDQGPLSVRRAAAVIVGVANGMAYAHDAGIIHRDLKPANLMMDQHSQLKILDLGLARSTGASISGKPDSVEVDLTSHGTVVGTMGYMSPEQISHSKGVDRRTDVYSLGCTLHYLLTAKPPFTGTAMDTLVAHMRDAPPDLSEQRSDVSIELNAIFHKMIAKDVGERFQSMGEVAEVLQPFAEGNSTLSLASPSPSTPDPMQSTSLKIMTTAGSTTVVSRKAVGFDIGTNTAYATSVGEEGYPEAISNAGETATPSVLRFQDGEFTVGQEAVQAIGKDAANIADRFICRIGQPDTTRTLDGVELPYEVLAAAVARDIANNAQQQIGYFSHFVYTVPGCFGDAQRRAYADAFHIAYLETLDSFNASTACVVHFGFLHGWLNPSRPAEPLKQVLVVRFGGGSFDATVFRVDDRQIVAIALAGDTTLGGSVWDDRLVARVAEQLASKHGVNVLDDPARRMLLQRHCESGKVALTKQDEFPFRLQITGKSLEGTLKRGFVDRLGADLIERAEALIQQAMSDANLDWNELDHVLLAGGTSRMPVVRQAIERIAGSELNISPIRADAAPSGAALHAQMLIDGATDTLDFEVREVASHFYGVQGVHRETGKDRVSIVIPKNAPLPATGRCVIRTSTDGQTSLTLKIVEVAEQGGKPSQVGTCRVDNLPPGTPAGTPVEVDFHLSKNGIVSVFVESVATGRRTAPPIRRDHGLSIESRDQWRDWLYTGSVKVDLD